MCQTARFLGLFLWINAVWVVAATDGKIYTLAEVAKKIEAQLDTLEKIPATDAAATDLARASLVDSLDILRQKSVMLVGERKKQWDAIETQFELALKGWTQAAGAKDRAKPLSAMRKAWVAMKLQYPREALQLLPRLWSCPMHGELLLESAGVCPICGMSLEPVYVTQPQLTSNPIIRAEIIAGEPLVVGKKADLRIRLTFNDDKSPVTLDDLEEAHTRKIHLLITEPTETDYHHEHPEPAGNGEFSFAFTPALPGTYRVWADLKPARTHAQQFSIADIPGSTRAGPLAVTERENRHAEIDSYKFDLTFGKQIVHEKETVSGNLNVTAPSGQPCEQLEVVMGAFGHLVGFRDDFSTVLHMHPVGRVPSEADAHGGPDLSFYFRSDMPGLVRLFAQVKIAGVDYFPRFVVRVEPLRHIAQ